MRVLQTTTGVKVPGAMILAGFSKSDAASEVVRQQVRRRLELMGGPNKNRREVAFVNVGDPSSLSDMTGTPSSASSSSASSSSAPTNPKPKRKQIRSTSSSVQQWRIDDLAAKRHKSEAHKAAVRLFDAEKRKPDGMSIRQVHDFITSKYETCPGIATISRYVNNGLVGVSPMKGMRRGFSSDNIYKFIAYLQRTVICGTPKKTFTHVLYRKYRSIGGFGLVPTKPSASTLTPDVGVTTMPLLGV